MGDDIIPCSRISRYGFPLIYFIHIHRTGGSTFKAILRNNFGLSALYINDPKRANDEFSKEEYNKILSISDNLTAIESHHIRFPLTIDTHYKVNPVFIIRKPFERFISNYFYLQQIAGPDHYANQEINDYYRYVKDNHNPDVRYINGQTFHIAREVNLEKAKEIVDESFLVGTTEMFDQFLVLFREMIGNEFNIHYERRNTGIKRSSNKEKIQEIRNSSFHDMFMEENHIDTQLHDYVTEQLTKKIANISNFDEQLAEFKAINASYKYPYLKTKLTSVLSKTALKLRGLSYT